MVSTAGPADPRTTKSVGDARFSLSFLESNQVESKVFVRSITAAIVAEVALLLFASWQGSGFHQATSAAAKQTQFIEAQIFQPPPVAHLVDETKPISAPAHHEVALSKVPDKGRKAKPHEKLLQNKNQTVGGAPLAATHGPVVVYDPAPVIPSYLQDQYLQTSVVIEFDVTSQGKSKARLIGSSGNGQLDMIALETVKQWEFRPAQKNHIPISSQVRLRIDFQVK